MIEIKQIHAWLMYSICCNVLMSNIFFNALL